MQVVTSLEQSKALLSVGVPKGTADMFYVSHPLCKDDIVGPLPIMNNGWMYSITRDRYFLAWSLSTLLELIKPAHLFYEGGVWYCPWKCALPNGGNVHMPQGGATPFDAVYNAVKNNYIANGTNDK